LSSSLDFFFFFWLIYGTNILSNTLSRTSIISLNRCLVYIQKISATSRQSEG